MIPDLATVRHANTLVRHAQDGVLAEERYTALLGLAKTQPQKMAALVAHLAVTCAAAMPTEQPSDHFLRAAHAAHRRGEHAPWVRKGEREYQRVMKARRRKRGTP